MLYLATVHRFIASWFGSGLLLRRLRGADGGSGTVAGIVTLLPVWLLHGIGWPAQLAAAVVVTGLSLWAARPFAAGGSDPAWVVVDEAAGTFVATIGVGLVGALVGFAVFRLADITKRFPGVAAAERLPGTVGITADDLVAGVWGLAAGWAVQLVIG